MRSTLMISILASGLILAPSAFASDFAAGGLVVPAAQKLGTVGGGKVFNPKGGGPGVVYAYTSLKCGNTVYQLGTGNDSGKCTGTGSKRSCADGKGNSASVSCSGGCGDTNGAGTCGITAK